jgi:hypothetical protein
MQNETGIPESDSPETDPWGDMFTFELATLRESEAYKWLVSTVQRNVKINGVQPSRMRDHRQWFLALLDSTSTRISRRKKPDLYTAEFELSWNLMGFLQEQEYDDEDPSSVIGGVITLSGDDKCVQALPCKEYMEQIWPSTGPDFVQLFQRLVETPVENHSCK